MQKFKWNVEWNDDNNTNINCLSAFHCLFAIFDCCIFIHFRIHMLMRFLNSICWSIAVQFISSPGLMSCFVRFSVCLFWLFAVYHRKILNKFRLEFRHHNKMVERLRLNVVNYEISFSFSLARSLYLARDDLLRRIWYLSFPIGDRPAVICDMYRCVSSTNSGNNKRARILYNDTLPDVRHAYRRCVVSTMPSNRAPYHTVDTKTISSANILNKISNT